MTEPSIFPSIPAENGVFDRLDQAMATRSQAQSSSNALTSTRLSAFQQRYPWLSPNVALALAQSNVDPESDVASTIASATAKHKSSGGGFGWHSIGDLVSAAGSAVGEGLSTVGGALESVAQPVVRTALTGLQSLDQEAQGVIRNVASYGPVGAAAAGALTAGALVAAAPVDVPLGIGAGIVGGAAALGAAASATGKIQGQATWEPQSTGAIALQQMLKGQNVDLGSGWIPHPGDAIKQEQKARETVTVGGHALTPGRLLASGVVQPGSEPFNVLSGLTDASLMLSRFDPAGATAGLVGNVARNSRLFVDAGGLLADRPTILPEKALEWWNGVGGRAVAENLAAENSPAAIWKATNGKLPVDVVRDLAKTTDVSQVDQIIQPMLGAEIRGPLPYDTFKPLSNVRFLQMVPHTVIDLAGDRISQADAVTTAERWLKNVKAPQDLIDSTVSKMINADSPLARYRATADLMDATKQVLVDRWGVNPQKAADLTKLSQTAMDDTTKYFTDSIGENVQVPGMYVDGQMHGLPQPHLFAEFTNRTVSLPSPQDIRRTASQFAPILNNPAVQAGRATLEAIQDGIWKPLTLVRGALATRTLGEAQARMAAAGLDSAFQHPLSYIAWAANSDSKIGRALDAAGVDVGKGGADVLGKAFESGDAQTVADHLGAFQKSLNRGWAGLKDERYLPFWRKVTQQDPEFIKSWAGELLQLESDPIAREVARSTDGLDAVKQAFWDGNLSGYREQMAGNAGGLADRATADRYIESVADRINVKTGGDPTLLDVIGTSKLNGDPLRQGLRPSKDFLAHLADNLDIAPDAVKGQVSLREGSIGQRFDDATRWAFSKLMAEPQNKLVNSPTFKQLYWDRIRELAPMMTDEARAAAADMARTQGVGDVADVLDTATGGEHATLALDHADAVAKGDALDSTWKLLHKLTDRNQFFDAAKLVFPFGDAWAQMLGKWARIGVEHPESIVRASQVVHGGQDAGFFYKNAQGQEVFAYPGSQWVNGKLFGVPIPFTGRLDGLSMMTEVLPGVGPVVQVPAGALLPDKPNWDWARSILFPSGEPDTGSGVLEAFIPAWAQKLRESGVFSPLGIQKDKGQWNSTVFDVARYLSSTGNYDTSTPDGMAHLLDDARDKAKYMYLLRGAAQFVSPAAPTPDWMAQVKNSPMPEGTPSGLLSSGNLDLANRPVVKNDDGSVSTVRSITVTDENGHAVLIPTVVDGKVVSNDEAIAHWKQTGEHLGVFDSEAHADQYASALHDAQAGYYLNPNATHLAEVDKLVNEYHQLQQTDPQNATQTMLDKYGTGIFTLLQGKTVEVTPGAITAEGSQWERDHAGIMRSFPEVGGFFAPDQGGNLDSQAFQRQLDLGNRVRLTPEQALRSANNRLAATIYNQAKDKLGSSPNGAQRAWLTQLRTALMDKYPGYQDLAGLPQKADPKVLIPQVEKAVSDPRLADNPAANAARLYLEARQKASDASLAAGLSATGFQASKQMAPMRDWLRQVGTLIVHLHPEFQNLWDSVFSREMVDDTAPQPAQQGAA